MRINCVATDLDGTLLNNSKTIEDATITEIRKFIDNGGTIVLATGRHYDEVTTYKQEIGECYVICCDGLYVYDKFGVQIYCSVSLRTENVKEIFEKVPLRKIEFYTFNEDVTIYSSMIKAFFCRLKSLITNMLHKNKKLKRERIIGSSRLLNGLEWKIEKIIFYLRDITDSDFQFLKNNYTIHKYPNGKIEVMQKGVNKYSALQYLQKQNYIEFSHMVYIGDDYNDVECFEAIPIAIAMGNAVDEIKKLAYAVTASNDEGGVGNIIRSLNQMNET